MKTVNVIFCAGFCLLLTVSSQHTRAKEIWRIGETDNKCEFSQPESKVIDYIVPYNWKTLLEEANPNWGGFPGELYIYNSENSDDEEKVREININFPYPNDFHNPILVVRAQTIFSDPNDCFILEIMKFNKRIPLDQRPMYNRYWPVEYEFPLGLITCDGINDKNKITIRCYGPASGYLLFDALYLYYNDSDSDSDGVWDSEEGNYAGSDPRIARISKVGRDPDDKKKFTLTIQEPEGTIPYFRKVRLDDPNDPIVSEQLKSSYYFPYGLLGFQIAGVEEEGQVTIHIAYTDTHDPTSVFSASLCCFAYKNMNIWQEVDFSFVDGNTIALNLQDGGDGDSDKGEAGSIDVILALSYTQQLDVSVDKGGCFLYCLDRKE